MVKRVKTKYTSKIFHYPYNDTAHLLRTSRHTAPVIKLEMMSGRINIFSILIRMSPGKAITITISGWIGEATRSNIPATAPKMTPEVQGGERVNETEKR